MTDLYELTPAPRPPDLPGTVVVRDTVEDLTESLGVDLLLHAYNCVRAFGDVHIALSGGSTPEPFYRRLMTDPKFREFPWKRTHVWIVDERRVDFDDERSNVRMISQLIGDHSGIPPEQFHPIFALAEDADVRYERTLLETLGWREKGHDRLDFVLLGMGADGHTASLFPHSPALIHPEPAGEATEGPLVRINAGPAVTPPDRVTMTYRLLNSARFVAVLVTGSAKRETLQRVIRERRVKGAYLDLPILGVRPVGGELRWYLDRLACPGDDGAPGSNGHA